MNDNIIYFDYDTMEEEGDSLETSVIVTNCDRLFDYYEQDEIQG